MDPKTDNKVAWSIFASRNGYTITCDWKGARAYIATCASRKNAEMVLLALSEAGSAYLIMRDAMTSMGAT